MAKLEGYLSEKLGARNLSITAFSKNLEGWSMETFSLGLSYEKDGREVKRNIIIRKEPVAGLLEPYDVSIEYRVLTALKNTGIAIPETYWHESDPSIMGLPFYVMEKVEGIVHFFSTSTMFDPNWKLIPNEKERLSLAEEFVNNIALIHNVDWSAKGLEFLGDPGPGKGSALRQVAYWRDVISRAGFGKKPSIAYALNWLMDNPPECDRVCLLHGDYRTGNYIAQDGHIKAVLDWEMVHLGDPMEDISYVIASVWRSRKPDSWISHLLPEKDFFAMYEAKSGIKIDREKIKFYHVFNNFKAVGIPATAANAFRSKPNLDLKVGVFGMMIYAAIFGLVQSLNKYVSALPGQGV